MKNEAMATPVVVCPYCKSLFGHTLGCPTVAATGPAREDILRESGTKLDEGKPLLWRGALEYFPRALAAVAKVSEVGSSAPGHQWGGWRHVLGARERYTEALVRHLMAEARGQTIDPSDALHEDAKVAWNALCRLELRLMEEAGGGPQPVAPDREA